MSDQPVKIGIVKLGCVGALPLIDILLDERADREDIEIRSFSSGAKLDPDSCKGPTDAAIEYNPNFAIVVSPNAALPGPTDARTRISEKGIPVITISDGPAEKAFYTKNEKGKKVVSAPEGVGFIILPMDPMIGARREFLDPTEMVLFNAELLRLFSATGVIRFLQQKLDAVIEQIKAGASLELPRIKAKPEKIIAAGGFGNPYAATKAYAALKIAENVANITTTACFKTKEKEKWIKLCSVGHEMLRAAAELADEAREIEKTNDSVLRTPHARDGKMRSKKELLKDLD